MSDGAIHLWILQIFARIGRSVTLLRNFRVLDATLAKPNAPHPLLHCVSYGLGKMTLVR